MMVNLLILSACLYAIVHSTTAETQCCATIYQSGFGQGETGRAGYQRKKVCGDLADVGSDWHGGLGISAIIVDSGCIVDVYQQANYGGSSKMFTSIGSMDLAWDDKVNSLKVRRCCATIYQGGIGQAGYQSKEICGDLADVGSDWQGGLGVSAINIDNGCAVDVYQLANYGGATKVYTSAQSLDLAWNDNIKSLRVRPACL